MSDYISKSALMDALIYCDGLGRKSLEAVVKTINEQPTISETEIIRKPFERVVERLEEEARNYKAGVLQKLYFETGVARSILVVKEEGGIE